MEHYSKNFVKTPLTFVCFCNKTKKKGKDMKKNKLKEIPKFRNEDEERDFLQKKWKNLSEKV